MKLLELLLSLDGRVHVNVFDWEDNLLCNGKCEDILNEYHKCFKASVDSFYPINNAIEVMIDSDSY